jgi:major vault protein
MADQNRELVLVLGTYAHILDQTKGHINVIVGPFKTTASQTDLPVRWNGVKYEPIADLNQAILPFTTAPEGFYVILNNPADKNINPNIGTSSIAMPLQVGRKINIPGPISFPLWPSQTTKVVEGHHLRSNQYLVVRVYNDTEARANWKNAVIKKVANSETPATPEKAPDLVMGQLLVIKGTDVAFYIPPTGIEVVPDEDGQYVREAVTLERLEYTILLDEDGNKRYIPGPDVVFPKPTETFITKDNARKFRAIELSEISGIHIKVIAPYDNKKIGDELFITGKETPIYYPRPEHAIIKYDDREIHFAVAVPEGDARYVLERLTGKVKTVHGPVMLLPDPRTEVIVNRILDAKLTNLLYPGNTEALQHNQKLQQEASVTGDNYVRARRSASNTAYMYSGTSYAADDVQAAFAGDALSRKTRFTPPRTVTLENKYDGVVKIQLWNGYAMLIVNSSGKSRVEVGPTVIQLEYDEVPQTFVLSTGKPKTTDNLLKTVYLKVSHNQVSDIFTVTTKDMVDVTLKVGYRVDFLGEKDSKWFRVDNYVKFLCDHGRSLMKNAAKSYGISEFYGNAINIIRDTILGVSTPETKRPGRTFDENGMCIYDVEVLDITIANNTIANLLTSAQHNAVSDIITVAEKERKLAVTKKVEAANREMAAEIDATREATHEIDIAILERALISNLKNIKNEFEATNLRSTSELGLAARELEAKKAQQQTLDSIAAAELEREVKESQARIDTLKLESDIEVKAITEKMKAMSSDLMTSLKVFGDQALLQKLADALAPMAIAQNVPVVEVARKMFAGTPLESILASLSTTVANKTSK